MICGGFMPLRADADDLSGFGPMVNVTRVDGATSTPLLVVGGVAAHTASNRRLVATACSESRSRSLGIRADAKSLGSF